MILLLLTQCYYHWGTLLNAMEEVLFLQPMIHLLTVLTFLPPDWGMLRKSRRVQMFRQITVYTAVVVVVVALIVYIYVCMYVVCIVITYSRVWINRVRLPILLVVS